MKKSVAHTFALVFLSLSAFGQHSFDPKNARDGETVEYCHQHIKLEQLKLSDPSVYQQIMADQVALEAHMRSYVPEKSETIYTIPVVFHIVHNGGSENISDDQVYDAVEILNRDFRRLNDDADHVHSDFQGMPADIMIEFRLATIAPDGTCFNGITRTKSPHTNNITSGADQLSAAFYGNNVYQGNWDHNKYLNIIVAKDIGGAAGYTYYPNDGNVLFNSIWILSSYVGSIGTSSPYTSRTLTHEVGHWLNLKHTWGGTNNPGLLSNCDDDDDVTDTPNTIGSTTCNLNENTCGPRANVENYMEYAYCDKMFTPGQADRMRAAVISPTGGRTNLWTTTNLDEVGAIDSPPLCKADFSADKQVICAGETIQFNDESYNSVDGWEWIFEGGSPAVSNEENPSITYSLPGTYEVSLTASQGTESEQETKTAFITVLPAGAALPFHEGFESYETLEDAGGKWFTETLETGESFEVTSTAGHTGSRSVKLTTFSTFIDTTPLVSSTIDLSGESVNNMTFSYRYAHRRAPNDSPELFKVFFSPDCGNSWVHRNPSTSSLVSSPVGTIDWIPAAEDWITVHIPFNTVAYTAYLNENFRFKFEFSSIAGSHLYIDDINIYRGDPSEDVVLTLDKQELLSGVSLFPNPSDGEVHLTFSLEQAQPIALKVTDISGKELKTSTLEATSGKNTVLLDNSGFAPGLYLIELGTSTSRKTLPFVKK